MGWLERLGELFARGQGEREREAATSAGPDGESSPAGEPKPAGESLEDGGARAVGRGPDDVPRASVAAGDLSEIQSHALAHLQAALALGVERGPPVPDLLERIVDAPSADLQLLRGEETRALGLEVQGLARLFVDSLVRGPEAVDEEALGEQVARVTTLASEQVEGDAAALLELGDRHREESRRALDAVVQEQAVDRHQVVLEGEPGGKDAGMEFSWGPAPEPKLEMLRLERVLESLETTSLQPDFLALQRRVSRWHFRRYTTGPRSRREGFGQRVREQEWALVEREIPGPDGSLLGSYLDQGLVDRLPPGQASLAERLAESTAGVFEVLEARGDEAVFENVTSGRRHRVLEHNSELGYTAGEVGLGRIIPAEGGDGWLRSPGMAFVGGGGGELGRVLRETLDRADREGMPRALTVELTLRALLGNEEIREPRPALSRKLAKERLKQAGEILEEAGFAERVPEEVEASGEGLSVPGSETRLLNLHLDPFTAMWLSALDEQGRSLG